MNWSFSALVMAISASDEYASGVSSMNRYAIRSRLPGTAKSPEKARKTRLSARHRLYRTHPSGSDAAYRPDQCGLHEICEEIHESGWQTCIHMLSHATMPTSHLRSRRSGLTLQSSFHPAFAVHRRCESNRMRWQAGISPGGESSQRDKFVGLRGGLSVDPQCRPVRAPRRGKEPNRWLTAPRRGAAGSSRRGP